jgi:hypothetical protein
LKVENALLPFACQPITSSTNGHAEHYGGCEGTTGAAHTDVPGRPTDRLTDPLGKGRMCAEPLDERHESAAEPSFHAGEQVSSRVQLRDA